MSTLEQVIKAYVTSIVANKYILVDQPVALTGQYAVSASKIASTAAPSGNVGQLMQSMRDQLLLEVRFADPELRTTKWVKLDDLFQVGQIAS